MFVVGAGHRESASHTNQSARLVLPVVSGCQQPGGIGVRAVSMPAQAATVSVTPTEKIHAGERLIFKLVAPAANRDPAAIDTIVATLVTSSGDRETVTAYETGVDTGEFVGEIGTRANPPDPVQGDCVLSLVPGDRISIECIR